MKRGTNDMTTLPLPIASASVPWTVYDDIPNFRGRARHLTRAVYPDYRIGVLVEELPPGGRSAPLHYHMLEEEHVYMLEGVATLRLGDATRRMAAGDYVCFPAGQRAGHCLVNDGDAPCRYVVVGERNPNDVIVYPDSNKVRVRSLGPGAVLDLAARRGYWDGEDTGLPAAPPPEAVPAPAAEPAPKQPVATDAVPWDEEGPGTGSRFGGRSRHLTGAALGGPDYHVGVLIEAPAPGRRLAPKHWHTAEEEHALVLTGRLTLLLGDERHEMGPGDYAVFPAGQPVGHSFINSGSGEAAYLMIGGRVADDVCVYADSAKVGVSALPDGRNLFDATALRRYWDGEALD